MVLIASSFENKHQLIFGLRLISGFVWLGTFLRRITNNYGNFESRISEMATGDTIFPKSFMEWAVENWFEIYLMVLTFEIVSSLSLLTGTFARGGAFIATINGFGIGMAGIGLGLMDLIVPWSVAMITLALLLFTHPGRYKGFDKKLSEMDLPLGLSKLT